MTKRGSAFSKVLPGFDLNDQNIIRRSSPIRPLLLQEQGESSHAFPNDFPNANDADVPARGSSSDDAFLSPAEQMHDLLPNHSNTFKAQMNMVSSFETPPDEVTQDVTLVEQVDFTQRQSTSSCAASPQQQDVEPNIFEHHDHDQHVIPGQPQVDPFSNDTVFFPISPCSYESTSTNRHFRPFRTPLPLLSDIDTTNLSGDGFESVDEIEAKRLRRISSRIAPRPNSFNANELAWLFPDFVD